MQISAIPAWLWYYRGDPLLHLWLERGALVSGAIAFVILLVILKRGRTLHGEARFARESEIRREHLRSKSGRSEEHTSELQSLMRTSYAVSCLKKKKNSTNHNITCK